jgi:hypothetical protein
LTGYPEPTKVRRLRIGAAFMSTVGLTIPQSPEELTNEWLTAALREGKHIQASKVTSFTTEIVGQGVGFVGLLARVLLEYDRPEPGAPSSLVGKFPSPSEASRAIAILFGLYEREVLFYRDLQPDVPMASPSCYYAAMDKEAGRYLILLEDLDQGTFGDQVAGCTVEQAKLVLKELAKLHAAWWENPKLDELSYLPDYVDLISGALSQAYEPTWPLFVERCGHLLSPAMLEAGATMGPKLVALVETFRARPRTLCHSDFRVDNVFFGNAAYGRPVVVVDWQAPLRSWAAAYDAIYFIVGGLPVDVRRAHETELLRVYHDELVSSGVTTYSFEQLVEDARVVLLYFFGIIGVIAAGSLDMANDRAVELLMTIVTRLLVAMEDQNVLALLPE